MDVPFAPSSTLAGGYVGRRERGRERERGRDFGKEERILWLLSLSLSQMNSRYRFKVWRYSVTAYI